MGAELGAVGRRACPELIENPSQIARFRLSENSLPDAFRGGTLIGVVVAIIVIMPMISSSGMTRARHFDPDRTQGAADVEMASDTSSRNLIAIFFVEKWERCSICSTATCHEGEC